MPPKDVLDQFIDVKISQYIDSSDDDEGLWARFADDFIGWTEEFFQTANRTKVVRLRTCLREHGVRVEMDGRKVKMAAALAQVVQEEEPGEWTTADIERFKKDNLTVLSKQLEGRIEGAHIGARAASQRVGSAAPSASVSGSRIGSPRLQPQDCSIDYNHCENLLHPLDCLTCHPNGLCTLIYQTLNLHLIPNSPRATSSVKIVLTKRKAHQLRTSTEEPHLPVNQL
jgi:hypothetical protein